MHDWPHRCPICDLPCKSDRGVKIHIAKTHSWKDKTAVKVQNFKGTLADEAVKVQKWSEQQKHRPTILCGGKSLENVFKFTYIGSIFVADGKQSYDV